MFQLSHLKQFSIDVLIRAVVLVLFFIVCHFRIYSGETAAKHHADTTGIHQTTLPEVFI